MLPVKRLILVLKIHIDWKQRDRKMYFKQMIAKKKDKCSYIIRQNRL